MCASRHTHSHTRTHWPRSSSRVRRALEVFPSFRSAVSPFNLPPNLIQRTCAYLYAYTLRHVFFYSLCISVRWRRHLRTRSRCERPSTTMAVSRVARCQLLIIFTLVMVSSFNFSSPSVPSEQIRNRGESEGVRSGRDQPLRFALDC